MGLFDGTPLERPVLCERCQQDVKTCTCPPEIVQEPDVAPEKMRLAVRIEKRKNGRFVTAITGFNCPKHQITNLFVELKNHLGAGGTSDEKAIEIQGQHLDKVQAYLTSKAYKIAKK